ncbi:MAG: HD domain-containing protein [Desulfobulbaceae bacterium]|nr:MAG: HD domain-containing protein [Desulfobulbaceae bacterium]
MDKKVNDIIILLCKGISNRRLYFSNHPKVISYAQNFLKELTAFFEMSEKEEFFVGIIDGHFIFNGKRLFGPTIVGRQLIQFMQMLQCGGVSFKKGLTVEDLSAFMDLTDGLKNPLNSLQEARELFKKQGILSITLAGYYSDQPGMGAPDNKRPWEGQEAGGFLQSPTLIYQALFDVVTRAHGDAAFSRELDIDSARSVSEFMLRFTQSNFADVMQYIHYPDYDSYTIGHSVRVSSIAVFLGMKMNWPEENILAIGTAGILHDIGKSRIASEILYKTSKLTADEFRLIQDHPRVGAELLLAQRDVSPLDIAAAWGHHLRYDGKGYPEKPSWAVRNPVIALLQICDVFEALTAVRPYKQAMDPQHAFSVMTTDKGAFHPGLLSAFIAFIGIYPPGTYVELTDGRIGMVTGAGIIIDRPQLKIIQHRDGTRLKKEDQYDVDLGTMERGSLGVSQLLLNYLDSEN